MVEKYHRVLSFEELPAVGHKTAGVVMSQALVLLLSGRHIHRLMYR
jgi:endonuclease III